jgi:hypothetical protein
MNPEREPRTRTWNPERGTWNRDPLSNIPSHTRTVRASRAITTIKNLREFDWVPAPLWHEL